MKKEWVVPAGLLLGLFLTGTVLARPLAATVSRWVIGGGGGSGTVGGMALDGTIGQWAVGSGTSGGAHLQSGFWGGGDTTGPGDEERIYLPLVFYQ